MGQITKTAVVPAPPATVYRYVADLHNAPEFITAISRITSGPTESPAVGQRFGAAATFMGRPETLTLCLLALDPDRRVEIALEGDPAATLTISLAALQDRPATRVTVRLEAPSVAGFLLGMTMGPMLDASLARLARKIF
ncbi:MAG: SRPBCC family protein [Chloroflexia bacterium]